MKALPIAVMVVAATTLAACGTHKTRLRNSNSPDEFAISRAAPLIVPPDFSLTPPKPGEPRALADDAQTNAVDALFGPGVKIPPKSPAEVDLLDKAGAAKTDPVVRSNAGDPQTPTVNKGAFLRELMSAPAGTANPQIAEVKIGR
ncbi:MAG: DUF3035 domain-containing protein [Janthinobacterium lividum]